MTEETVSYSIDLPEGTDEYKQADEQDIFAKGYDLSQIDSDEIKKLIKQQHEILDTLEEKGHKFELIDSGGLKAFKRGKRSFIVTGRINPRSYAMREVTNYL